MKADEFVRLYAYLIDFKDCQVQHFHYDTTIALHFTYDNQVFNIYKNIDEAEEYLNKMAKEVGLEEDVDLEIIVKTPSLQREYTSIIYSTNEEAVLV